MRFKSGDEFRTVADIVKKLPSFGKRPCVAFKTDFRTFRYSYSALHDHIIDNLHLLKTHKITKGDRVLLWAPNSPAWVSSFLAITSSGAVAVPMDFRATAEMVGRIAKEATPSLALIGRGMPTVHLSCPTLLLDPVWAIEESPRNFKNKIGTFSGVNPSDLMEIVYTSGTTGKPKGVMLTHSNVTSNTLAALDGIQLGPSDSSISLLPLSHMFEQVANLFSPLMKGSSVVYLERLNRRMLMDALATEHPSVVPIVPRLLELLRHGIENTAAEHGRLGLLQSLQTISRQLPPSSRRLLFPGVWKIFPPGRFRFFAAGGAPLDEGTEGFFEDLGLPILQGYGLTETSPVLTISTMSERKQGCVGKQLPGVTLSISADGEILAKGPNITQGYYNNPAKTKALFKNKWLATGDLGSVDADGFVHILGRKKDMIVTSGGMNVYPEDVESVLNKIPGVRDSAVIGWPKKPEEEVHAVLLLSEKSPLPRTIISSANAALPSFSRITGYTVWPHPDFPRTTTMKVKKFHVLAYLEQLEKKHRKPHATGHYTDAAAPALHRLIAHVTKKPASFIKPSHNLTADLGLSSLDRVELLSAIEDSFGVTLPDEVITPATTVAKLERLIRARPSLETKLPFRPWVLSWPAHVIRILIQMVMVFPITLFFTRTVVTGYGHVRNLKGPLLIVCNHTSHADTPVLLMSLPSQVREFVCPVGLLEYFRVKGHHPFLQFLLNVLYEWACLAGLMIPFPQTAGFGQSMRYAGTLVDRGYSILIFPEGARSLDGKIHEFKDGVGLMAVHYRIPILPVRVRGLREVLPRGAAWPTISPSSIHFGKPFTLDTDDYHEATRQIEQAVRGL